MSASCSPLDLAQLTKPCAHKIQAFGELVRMFPDKLELESRLFLRPPVASSSSGKSTSNGAGAGSSSPGGLQATVPESYFKQILSFLKRNFSDAGVTFQVVPWFECTDYYFANNVRCTKQGNTCSWQKKIKLFNTDFLVPERPLGVRVSLKAEQTCDPVTETPTFVRFKKRCSFIDQHLRIDFTMVRQGKNDYEMRESAPKYEIEVELVNKHFLRAAAATATSGEDIVSDLLVRTLELLGTETPLSICEWPT